MSKRVLVTGGAGYVGSVVVDELLRRGYEVRVLDVLLHGSVPSLLLAWPDTSFEFIHGDVRDAATVDAALEDVSAVVHLAAVVGDPACSRQPELARTINLSGTQRLLDAAAASPVSRFLFASTCSNYGKLENGALATEEGELNPVSLYAETKVAAEHAVLERTRPGFSTACLRFATVFGTSPRMRFDLTVNEFARDVCLNGELVVYGEQFWRPYVHVRDVARALCIMLEAEDHQIAGEVFNVGDTTQNFRKLDIVDLLRQRFPSANIEFVHRDEDPRDYRVSFEKFRNRFAFCSSRTVADGIDEVVRLVRSGLVADPYAASYRN